MARKTESQADNMAETVAVVHAGRISARAKRVTDYSHGDPITSNADMSFPHTSILFSHRYISFSNT